MAGDGQAEVLAFLEGGGLGEGVERIDTHGAIVLLAGERALKLKRVVRFSFMDFSTLAKRRAALEAELSLNRRTAPELYRRLVAVTREPDDGLALDGTGGPVEWLLEMARFPEDAQLDRVAARGELGLDLVEDLAAEIFRFHGKAEVRRDRGGAAAMREVIEGNASDLTGLAPVVFAPDEVAAVNAATLRELDARAALLDRRRDAGRVRRCHGDLHLPNIVLLDRGPVLFDCLEFDEDLATIDVLYDLAFLAMDLVHRRLPAHARTLLQAYGDLALDDEGLALLPLFLSVRAAIRAKVAGFNAGVLAGEARAAKVAEAHAYLALACQALEPVPPRLLVVAGRSGTGKSSVARALAPSLGAMPGAMVLRSDVLRKRLFGKALTERLPPEAYAPEQSAHVFGAIADRARTLLAAGRTVIADAVYGRPEEREAIAAVAEDLGVPFRPVWLEAAQPVLEERVAARRGDASDADVAVVRLQARAIMDPDVSWPRVAAGRPLQEVAAEVARIWRS
jgi:aminoglycoside phosphotransferase family enzyme/predicted kinase